MDKSDFPLSEHQRVGEPSGSEDEVHSNLEIFFNPPAVREELLKPCRDFYPQRLQTVTSAIDPRDQNLRPVYQWHTLLPFVNVAPQNSYHSYALEQPSTSENSVPSLADIEKLESPGAQRVVEVKSLKRKIGTRRPVTAFKLFCDRNRAFVCSEYPELSNRIVGKVLVKLWSILEKYKKLRYRKLAKEINEARLKEKSCTKDREQHAGPSKNRCLSSVSDDSNTSLGENVFLPVNINNLDNNLEIGGGNHTEGRKDSPDAGDGTKESAKKTFVDQHQLIEASRSQRYENIGNVTSEDDITLWMNKRVREPTSAPAALENQQTFRKPRFHYLETSVSSQTMEVDMSATQSDIGAIPASIATSSATHCFFGPNFDVDQIGFSFETMNVRNDASLRLSGSIPTPAPNALPNPALLRKSRKETLDLSRTLVVQFLRDCGMFPSSEITKKFQSDHSDIFPNSYILQRRIRAVRQKLMKHQ